MAVFTQPGSIGNFPLEHVTLGHGVSRLPGGPAKYRPEKRPPASAVLQDAARCVHGTVAGSKLRRAIMVTGSTMLSPDRGYSCACDGYIRKLTQRTLSADRLSGSQGTDLLSPFPERAVGGHPRQGQLGAPAELR